MKKTIIITLLAIGGIAAEAQVSFNDALAAIIAQNPEIAAMKENNSSQISEAKGENMLEGPEIEFAHLWGKEGTKIDAGISQSFDWPGAYRARKRAVDATSNALSALERSTLADKTLEAKLLLIDYISDKHLVRNLAYLDSTMRQLQRRYNEAFKRGEVNILDVNKIQIEVLRISSRYRDRQNRISNTLALIENLAGSNSVLPLVEQVDDYPEVRILSEEDYERRIIETDPQIAYYESMKQLSKENESVARLAAYPGLSLGYGFVREEGQNFNGITFGLRFGAYSTKHQRAAARHSALENQILADTERMRRITDMRNDLETAIDFRKQEAEYSAILSGGRQMELLKKAFEGGEINLLTYLQELNYFIEAMMDYEDTRYQLHQNLANLNKLEIF